MIDTITSRPMGDDESGGSAGRSNVVADYDLAQRPRRLRTTAAMRALVAESGIEARHLIAPFFVTSETANTMPQDVAGMPGVRRHTPEGLLVELERVLALGVRSVLLFGVV